MRKERADLGYFTTPCPAPAVIVFAGGQVASKLSSADARPSLENFAVCAMRRPVGRLRRLDQVQFRLFGKRVDRSSRHPHGPEIGGRRFH
jgi:hypothetical protein